MPEYFRPIIEFREILKAHGYSLDKLDETSEKVKDNNYIATCDEETIAYYEKLLGITYGIPESTGTAEIQHDRSLFH